MDKHNDKFEFSATLEATQVAKYLVRIADGLRQGIVGLAAGEDTVWLAPTAMVALEIEAEGKAEKAAGHLTLELSWKPEYALAADTLAITVDPRAKGDPVAPAGARE